MNSEITRSDDAEKLRLRALRTVAAFEFAKGLLVALVGLGLLSLAHRDIDAEDMAQTLLYVLHLDNAPRLSRVFLDAAARFDDVNLLALAMVAAVYAILRCVEAYGLWKARVWAQWFALISGAVYVPLEVYELFRRATTLRWTLLAINLAIVAYMAYLRMRPSTRLSTTTSRA